MKLQNWWDFLPDLTTCHGHKCHVSLAYHAEFSQQVVLSVIALGQEVKSGKNSVLQ
jgi:hypothetical protein